MNPKDRIKKIEDKLDSKENKFPEVITIHVNKLPGESRDETVKRYEKENNIIDDGSKVYIYILE